MEHKRGADKCIPVQQNECEYLLFAAAATAESGLRTIDAACASAGDLLVPVTTTGTIGSTPPVPGVDARAGDFMVITNDGGSDGPKVDKL